MESNKKTGFQSVNAANSQPDEFNPYAVPQNIEAEQGLIGSVIYDNLLYDLVSDIIRADHFYSPIHQMIWLEISSKIDRSEKVTTISLAQKFSNDRALEGVDGAQYFSHLVADLISTANTRHYAELVVEAYKKRSFYNFADEVKDRVKNRESTELEEFTDKFLSSIISEEKAEMFTISDTADIAIKNMEEMKSGRIKPMTTSIGALDKKISGLFGGRLYIVAGRPAMGKTALALTIAVNLSNSEDVISGENKDPIPVLYFSLEMPKEELSMRLIARDTGISVERQQSTEPFSKEEWDAIRLSKEKTAKKKLFIIDRNCDTLSSIRAFSRRFARSQNGRGVIIIDYLGLMTGDKTIQNKVHQIEQITTGLKRLAKEINCPVVLLCQLSRAVESRDDKRPMLSDLRDSGSIEQDADMVLFCHREEYYLNTKKIIQYPRENRDAFLERTRVHEYELEQSRGKAEIIVSKYRQGTTGIVKVDFKGLRQEFC